MWVLQIHPLNFRELLEIKFAQILIFKFVHISLFLAFNSLVKFYFDYFVLFILLLANKFVAWYMCFLEIRGGLNF